jgi:hypothetical protein
MHDKYTVIIRPCMSSCIGQCPRHQPISGICCKDRPIIALSQVLSALRDASVPKGILKLSVLTSQAYNLLAATILVYLKQTKFRVKARQVQDSILLWMGWVPVDAEIWIQALYWELPETKSQLSKGIVTKVRIYPFARHRLVVHFPNPAQSLQCSISILGVG